MKRLLLRYLRMVANCKASIDNERYPIGHFPVALSLCSKARQSENLLISKWLFILMQVKLIFKRKVLHHCSLVLKVRFFGAWKWPGELVLTKFIRWLSGVNKFCSSNGCRSEIGHFPTRTKSKCRAIKLRFNIEG